MNGKALVDLKDDSGQVVTKAGTLLDGFAQLRDDGSTASACWIFSGCYTEKGNQMARRDAADPREQGIAPGWAWAWPANRRILYNRASADLDGKPWNPAKCNHPMERLSVGWPRRAGLRADHAALGGRRTVHHAAGRPRAIVRARRYGRGAISRALRALRVALGEHSSSEGQEQSRCARLCRRPREFRDRGKLSLCRHDLSTDRTFPFLDEACADQRDPAAGGIRRNRRGARQGEGHRAGRLGTRLVQARRDDLQGLCHQAHQAL